MKDVKKGMPKLVKVEKLENDYNKINKNNQEFLSINSIKLCHSILFFVTRTIYIRLRKISQTAFQIKQNMV